MKTLLFVSMLMILACKTEDKKDCQIQTPTAENLRIKTPISKGNKRMLFVGNSNTEGYVRLHELFKVLCAENNKDFEVEILDDIRGPFGELNGMSKEDTTKVYLKKDVDGNYFDYVVLQDKIPVGIEVFDEYKTNVNNFLNVIYRNSPGIVVLISESITPLDYKYERSDFVNIFHHIKSNALDEVKEIPNSKILKIGSALKDAYEGENGYEAFKGNDDLLRHGVQNPHMLNDAGFLASVVLYETVFGTEPKIPTFLPFCTGVDEDDTISLQKVDKVVSNKTALMNIAYTNK